MNEASFHEMNGVRIRYPKTWKLYTPSSAIPASSQVVILHPSGMGAAMVSRFPNDKKTDSPKAMAEVLDAIIRDRLGSATARLPNPTVSLVHTGFYGIKGKSYLVEDTIEGSKIAFRAKGVIVGNTFLKRWWSW